MTKYLAEIGVKEEANVDSRYSQEKMMRQEIRNLRNREKNMVLMKERHGI